MITLDLLGFVKYPLMFWCIYAGHLNGWQALLFFLFSSNVTIVWRKP